jgi:hypothetical protein
MEGSLFRIQKVQAGGQHDWRLLLLAQGAIFQPGFLKDILIHKLCHLCQVMSLA